MTNRAAQTSTEVSVRDQDLSEMDATDEVTRRPQPKTARPGQCPPAYHDARQIAHEALAKLGL